MANDTTITIIGNTTAPAELRFTPAGAAVVNFTVASTPRTFDRTSNEWKDGTTLFMRCSAWREAAENIAESLDKPGTRVVVVGRLTQREYEKDGQKRTVIELEADEVAPSLKYATAKVTKTQRKDGNGGGFGNSQQPQQQPPAQGQGGWGGQPQNNGGWGNGPTGNPNEPAF